MPEITHVADLTIFVGVPVEAGETSLGRRRIIPILGGEVSGPRLRGRVLEGGADFQILRHDSVVELEAHYAIEMETGGRIYVTNTGFRHGPAEAMASLNRGDAVDPAMIYFCTTPRFETIDEKYWWLTRHIFIGTGARHPSRVELAVYQVM
jgi:hypothetical protein